MMIMAATYLQRTIDPMHPLLRNLLAVLTGAAVCILLNGVLLELLMRTFPPPPGFEPETPATYALLGPVHYALPFAAHAIPSLAGGLIAALIASVRKRACALAVGGLHLLGGIAAAFMIPAPAWFIVLDLATAYLPMAWAGWRLVDAMS